MSTTSIDTLTAGDIMTRDPVCATPNMSARVLAQQLNSAGVSGLPVVDHRGVLIGVVSKSDLVRGCIEQSEDYEPAYLFEIMGYEDEDELGPASSYPEQEICVEDIMSGDPIAVGPDAPVRKVASRLADAGVHRAIVVDDDRCPIGIVTSLDLVRVLARGG